LPVAARFARPAAPMIQGKYLILLYYCFGMRIATPLLPASVRRIEALGVRAA
jgi:hypothetical protein